MKNLKFSQTIDTPEIFFDYENGILNFRGKSIPENTDEFYTPVNKWITKYIENPKKNTTINFRLEYLNSGTNKYLLIVLKLFEKLLKKNMSVIINWYYEEGDIDILETGQAYKESLKFPVNLIEYID